LWGGKKRIWIELLICCFLSIDGCAQGLSLREMIAMYLFKNSFSLQAVQKKFRFTNELDYSLTTNGFFLIKWLHDKKDNQVNLYQNLRYQCLLQNNKNFRLSNTLNHNLGIQHYFDSITKVNIDDNTLITKLDVQIRGRFACTFDSRITSRLMNGFDYRTTDSGNQVRILNSSFLTPLTWTFSVGLGYNCKKFGSLSLGISAAKLTYILNRQIFGIRGITNYYGIEEGKTHLIEYGFTFQLLIDKDILKMLHWNCDLQLFKNYNAPADMMLKNLFGLRINKFFKTYLQTRIYYEEKLSKHLQFENILSVGLNLHR